MIFLNVFTCIHAALVIYFAVLIFVNSLLIQRRPFLKPIFLWLLSWFISFILDKIAFIYNNDWLILIRQYSINLFFICRRYFCLFNLGFSSNFDLVFICFFDIVLDNWWLFSLARLLLRLRLAYLSIWCWSILFFIIYAGIGELLKLTERYISFNRTYFALSLSIIFGRILYNTIFFLNFQISLSNILIRILYQTLSLLEYNLFLR